MKKFLAILMSVLLLVSGFCLTVTAADDNQFNDEEMDWNHLMGKVSVGAVAGNVYAGSTITVPVIIEHNPGITSIKLAVNYDTAVLELVAAEAVDFAEGENFNGLSFGDISLKKSPFYINWVDALATEDNTATGVLANLTFKVLACPDSGSTDITLTFNPDDIFSTAFNPVEFVANGNTVEIASFLPYDVDGNGKVQNRDVAALQKYLVGDRDDIILAAADIDGNGKIQNRDVAALQKYLVGA